MRYHFSTRPGILAIMARHGKTDMNASNTVRGWENPPLSDEGHIAAQMLANKLQKYEPKGVWSSELTRDHQTAEAIAKLMNIPHTPDYDLRTWDIGELAGKPEEEVQPTIAELYRQAWKTPPGSSENFNEFTSRFLNFIESKLQLCACEDFRPQVFVTHGRNLAIIDTYLNGDYGIDMMQAKMPIPAGYGLIIVNPDRSLSLEFESDTESVTS